MTEAVRRIRPPLDPELQRVIDAMPELTASVLPEHIEPIRRARRRVRDDVLTATSSVRFREVRVPGPAGAPDVAVLLLSPSHGTGPWPGIFYIHGGGMVFGDNHLGVETLIEWVEELDVAVVSVEYRLAPDHPYPAAADDCLAGLRWVHDHRADFGLAGPLMLAGTSAGGGLAAGLALRLRDAGAPSVSDLVLMAPMLDDRNVTPSSHELDGDSLWDRRSNITGWDAFLGARRAQDGVPVYAAPARAEDLKGLPPTYLDVGAVETFRDEVLDFGTRLARAGVSVEMHLWSGAFHGFDLFAPHSAVAAAARRTRVDYLRRRLQQRSDS